PTPIQTKKEGETPPSEGKIGSKRLWSRCNSYSFSDIGKLRLDELCELRGMRYSCPGPTGPGRPVSVSGRIAVAPQAGRRGFTPWMAPNHLPRLPLAPDPWPPRRAAPCSRP